MRARNAGNQSLVFKGAALCGRGAEIQTVVRSVMITRNSAVELVGLCPNELAAVGGGMDAESGITMDMLSSGPVFGAEGIRLLTQPNGQQPPPSGWRVHGSNTAAGDRLLKLAVTCVPATGLNTVAGSAVIAPTSFQEIHATCPFGMEAIVGGMDQTDSTSVSVVSSSPFFRANSGYLSNQPDGEHPSPVGWLASSRTSGGRSIMLRVAVICQQPPSLTFVPALQRP